MAEVSLIRAECGMSVGDGVGTAKPAKRPQNPTPYEKPSGRWLMMQLSQQERSINQSRISRKKMSVRVANDIFITLPHCALWTMTVKYKKISAQDAMLASIRLKIGKPPSKKNMDLFGIPTLSVGAGS